MNTTARSTLGQLVGLGVLLTLLTVTPNTQAGESAVTPAMAGHWVGNARIIVNWCAQTNLVVMVNIATNGTVTGKIGDATLVKGRFHHNRGWPHTTNDFIITSDLAGPLVAAEGITRSGVNVPLHFKGSHFTGGVHSTGWKVGGKDRMILSASHLRLDRTNTAPPRPKLD